MTIYLLGYGIALVFFFLGRWYQKGRAAQDTGTEPRE